MLKKYYGLTLIEMIIFILVIGIALFSIIRSLEFVSRHSITTQNQTVATEAANRCIQWYIGDRYLNGFSNITCPSTTVPSFCTAPTGFALTVSVTCISKYSSPTSAYKQITVTVSGKASAKASVILADYMQ